MPKVLAFDTERRRHAARTAVNEAETRQRETRPPGKPGADGNAKVARLFPAEGAGPESATRIAASIVVPTKGRPQLLNRCIASLVLQRFDAQRFEIIIVDDGPSDDTREVAQGWAAHTEGSGPDIVYIPSMGPHGPAAARNLGWQAARGAIIAFTDDDTIARADWLQSGLDAFTEHVDAVWGRIVMPLNGTPTDYELDAKGLETAEFVTANCFCRKRTLEDIGGFDERFRFAWREDADLYFNLLSYSANVVHAPNAVMTHPIRPARWGVSLSQVKKVQFDALLFKKHPALYRQKIRARPRWDFYLTVGSLLAAVAAALAEQEEAAALAGLLWFALTAQFCIKRLRKTSKKPSHVLEMIVTSILIPPLAVFWRMVGAFKFRARLL
jgi:glycosyltransferase involved in cell wall biosynthesis